MLKSCSTQCEVCKSSYSHSQDPMVSFFCRPLCASFGGNMVAYPRILIAARSTVFVGNRQAKQKTELVAKLVLAAGRHEK